MAALVVGFDLDMTFIDSRPGIAAAELVAAGAEQVLETLHQLPARLEE